MKKMREAQATYTPSSTWTIALPETVAKDLNELAKSEGIAVDRVVENALALYRRELGQDKIATEIEAYHRKYPRLRARYLGKYIAMHNGRVWIMIKMRARFIYGFVNVLATRRF